MSPRPGTAFREAVNVKKPGFTHFAVQLGICNYAHRPPGPSATPVGSGVGRAQHIRASKELVSELKPILDKYRKNKRGDPRFEKIVATLAPKP